MGDARDELDELRRHAYGRNGGLDARELARLHELEELRRGRADGDGRVEVAAADVPSAPADVPDAVREASADEWTPRRRRGRGGAMLGLAGVSLTVGVVAGIGIAALAQERPSAILRPAAPPPAYELPLETWGLEGADAVPYDTIGTVRVWAVSSPDGATIGAGDGSARCIVTRSEVAGATDAQVLACARDSAFPATADLVVLADDAAQRGWGLAADELGLPVGTAVRLVLRDDVVEVWTRTPASDGETAPDWRMG